MKKLLVINPNSSEQMTQDIRNTLSSASDNEFSITVTRTEGAPNVLESFSDYTNAGYHVLRRLEQLKTDGMPYDGVLLACMGDPCLYAVKEACPVPLIGIAEAALSTALLLGSKFSILASSAKAKPMMESMVQTYGLNDRMASVETFDLPIDEFMADPELLRKSIRKTAKSATDRGAEVLVLGCAGMTMLSNELESLADLPVIDPILAGMEQLKAVLRGNFRVSRAGLYK
ncbi:MAG: aspartate/glutamate racemase family protein [Oscillibacter sp.]|jgi:allantoin racemase|nr:aspartate/glutamate racemase family protein [Oscillibacter sp.]